MDSRLRDQFDHYVERVLAGLPESVIQKLDEVPLNVEDYPSDEVLAHFQMTDRRQLCGLYQGIPLSERAVSLPWKLPDVVTIYREGIIENAVDEQGDLHEANLIKQIRITILHEIGHHFGMTEEDLEAIGYG